MKRTMATLFVVAGLGVAGYLMAGDGLAKKSCSSLAGAKGEGGCCPSQSKAQLASYPSFKRANELIKSWQEVPAKLAAMTETDKTELQQAMEKLQKAHPAAGSFHPTIAFLNEGMATLTAIDAAAEKLCAEKCEADVKTASAEGVADEPVKCPVAAAALASAKTKMKQSAMLVAKANEVMLVAYKPADETRTAAAKEGACCGSAKTTTVAEGDSAKATLVSAEGKSSCSGDKAAAVADQGGAPVGAKLVSAEGKSACCGEKASLASADGQKKVCVKSITARAEAVASQSGALLAQWQGAGIRLAALDSSDRQAADQAVQAVMSRCPVGARTPETLEAVAGLLRDAAALSAQARCEVEKHADLMKNAPADAKKLCEARSMVLAAMLNVLEKSNGIMGTGRQVALGTPLTCVIPGHPGMRFEALDLLDPTPASWIG